MRSCLLCFSADQMQLLNSLKVPAQFFRLLCQFLPACASKLGILGISLAITCSDTILLLLLFHHQWELFQAVPSLLMEPTLECVSELPKKPHAVLVIDKQNTDDIHGPHICLGTAVDSGSSSQLSWGLFLMLHSPYRRQRSKSPLETISSQTSCE